MNQWLKGSMFGMPRWLWLSMLVAGVAGGLYLRNKNKRAAAAVSPNDPNAIDPATGLPYSSETQAYDPSLDPSLAGLGAYPSGGGSGSSYDNSYSQDLLSQLLSQQSGSDQVAQDLQDFIDQQNQYDTDLQDAIAAQDQGLQAAIKQQQKQLQKQIQKLQKGKGKSGKKKPKKHKSSSSLVGPHAGSGQRGRGVHMQPAQGHGDKRNRAQGRTHKNTPTGGGPPARPPHAHMPVKKRHKR